MESVPEEDGAEMMVEARTSQPKDQDNDRRDNNQFE